MKESDKKYLVAEKIEAHLTFTAVWPDEEVSEEVQAMRDQVQANFDRLGKMLEPSAVLALTDILKRVGKVEEVPPKGMLN